MKNRMVLGMLGLALAGTMMVNSPAFAQGNGNGKGHGMRAEKLEKATERLNLTADQKAKIKALREQFQATHQTALAEVKSLREQMKNAQKGSEQAKALRDQMKTKMEALRPAREQLHQQILAVLTPEQRAEMEKMKAERKERGPGKGRGKGRGAQGLN